MGASSHLRTGENSVRPFEELAALHAVASACAEATEEEALIEKITRVVARALYADNLGVLLLDSAGGVLVPHLSYRGISGKIRKTPIKLGEGISGTVALTGVTRNIYDIAVWETSGPLEQGCFSPITLSVLCVPLKVGERIIGVFHVESSQIGAFAEADERLLLTCAGLVATAVERLRAEASERQRAQELLAIQRISLDITSVLDQQQVLDLIVQKAVETSRAGASGLFAWQPDGRYYLVAAQGVGKDFVTAINTRGLDTAGTAVGKAIELRKPCQIEDIHREESYSTKSIARLEGIRAVLAIPMLKGERVIGGLVIWNRKPRNFSPAEEAFLQILAQQSVSAIENAQLFAIEREQRKMAEVLYETGAALNATLDLSEVLDLLLDQLTRLVPYDGANVCVVEQGWTRVIRCRGYEHIDKEFADKVSKQSFEIEKVANLNKMIGSRQPLVIADTQGDPEWIIVDNRFPLRSWAGAPVFVQGKVMVYFSLDKVEANFYQQEHIQPLRVFAGQAGLALNNARLFEELHRKLKESTLLSEVIALTAAATSLNTALNQVCARVAEFFGAQQAGFAVLDPEGCRMTVIAEYRTPDRPSAIGLHLPVQDNPSMTEVVQKTRPVAFFDAQNDPLLAPVRDIMITRDIASILIVPMIQEGNVVGTLGIDMLEKYQFSQADIDLMQDVATHVSQALARLRLFEAAKEHARRMAQLANFSEKLNQPLSVAQVIESIGKGARLLSEVNRAAVYLQDDQNRLTCVWSHGLSCRTADELAIRIEAEPSFYVQPMSETLVVNDIKLLPGDSGLRRLAEEEGICAFSLWPLLYEGEVKASVAIYCDQPHIWTESHQEILVAFTRQAAVALQNARLFHEISWRALQQEALNNMIAVAVNAPDLQNLLEDCLNLVMEALNVQAGSLWVNQHHAMHGCPTELNFSDPKLSKLILSVVDETLVISDWKEKQYHPFSEWRYLVEACGVQATLIVPVLARGVRIGALVLGDHHPRKWSLEEVALIEAVGRQLGGAAERMDLLAKTQEQANQMQQVIETVPEGVILLDEEKRVIRANPVARSYLEVILEKSGTDQPLRELGGVTIDKVLFPAPETPWIEITTQGAPPRIFEVAARPVEGGDQFTGWVSVLREVTAERENQSRALIQDRLATVGQLAAGIAHDFNNIMAAILVYADLLAMDPGIPHSSRERLGIIQSQIQRATSLIRQILDFSRRAVMEESQLDLLSFIKELEKLLRRVLPETINVKLMYQEGEYLLKADATRLQQALMNLSLNSRDAMPEGGELSFEIEQFHLKPNDFPPYPDLTPGSWICIQVADNGVGIPEEIRPRIFDPFFTTKPVGQGTGLGLAQVYGIIKQHGGSIDVHSSPGNGTRFCLYLPALESAEAEAPIIMNNGTEHGSGEKILVVEDDPVAREAIRILLDNLGYQVWVAVNGKEALQLYCKEKPKTDLVVSDLVMPEMGGLKLYRTLKERGNHVKFLFITGHPMESQEQELLQAGGVQWLQKPFSAQELAAGVRAMLNGTHNTSPI